MGFNVLIIDDNPDDRFIIKRSIDKADKTCSVTEAKTATEGLNILNGDKQFDCLFLDYRLPDMDGLDVLEKYMTAKKIWARAQLL